jgi:hypothetical protein
LNSLSSNLSNSYFSSRIFLLPTWISLSSIHTSWAVCKAKTRSNNYSSSASKMWFLARAFHLASLSVGTVGNGYMVLRHASWC